MPPNNTDFRANYVIPEEEEFEEDFHEDDIDERELKFRPKEFYESLRNLDYSKVVWRNVILFVLLHSYALYGVYLCLSGQTRWQTMLFSYALYWFGIIGVGMGTHRLWSHKCYKATLPLRVILMVGQTVAFQNSVYEWCRDHRVHHKHTETDADPHNAKRGFFFAHMGWLMYKKHPDVIRAGKTIDFSDLMADPVVKFQHENYRYMVTFFCFVLPTLLPVYLWNEHWVTALMVSAFMRYTFSLHCTWHVNSTAHYVGTRPYDKSIFATQNSLVSVLTLGEGWHNFHHVFPYDYRASEFGGFSTTNQSTFLIEMCAKLGLAYDLRAASSNLIEKRIFRTGDTRVPLTSPDRAGRKW